MSLVPYGEALPWWARWNGPVRVSGEAPAALLLEGVLNPINCAVEPSEARVRGEAPAALPVEGVLNQQRDERSEGEGGGSGG